jgi:hypothetical protein
MPAIFMIMMIIIILFEVLPLISNLLLDEHFLIQEDEDNNICAAEFL